MGRDRASRFFFLSVFKNSRYSSWLFEIYLSLFYHNIISLNLSRVHCKRFLREMCECPEIYWIIHALLSPLSYRTSNVIARFHWIAWEFFLVLTINAFSRDKRNVSRCYVPFLARYTKITNNSAHVSEFINNF